MNKLEISVIMPAHNAEAFIFSAIDSIVKQDFEYWELIVVDDASTDRTKDIVLSFQDSRIKLLSLAKNLGNYPARNIGLAEAKGQYVAVLDADDVALECRLSAQFAYLEQHTDIDVIGCGYTTIDSAGNHLGTVQRRCSYEELRVKLLADNFMLHSTMFMRHDFLKRHKITYNEAYTCAADYDFVFQCSKAGKIENCADTLIAYRVNCNSITSMKFKEQQHFASQIRADIFQYYFAKVLTDYDYKLIDQLFSRLPQTAEKISVETLELLLNKLLAYNYKLHLFKDDLLYNLFYCYAVKQIVNDKSLDQ